MVAQGLSPTMQLGHSKGLAELLDGGFSYFRESTVHLHNIQHERPEQTATGQRMESDLTGWLRSAPGKGSAC